MQVRGLLDDLILRLSLMKKLQFAVTNGRKQLLTQPRH
jgi:hypothetical protein